MRSQGHPPAPSVGGTGPPCCVAGTPQRNACPWPHFCVFLVCVLSLCETWQAQCAAGHHFPAALRLLGVCGRCINVLTMDYKNNVVYFGLLRVHAVLKTHPIVANYGATCCLYHECSSQWSKGGCQLTLICLLTDGACWRTPSRSGHRTTWFPDMMHQCTARHATSRAVNQSADGQ
jgi:hypothetical protein